MHQQHPVRWGSAVLDPYKNIKGINLVDMRYAATQAHVSSNVIHSLSSQFFKCENLKHLKTIFILLHESLEYCFFITESQVINKTGILNPQVMNQPETSVCMFARVDYIILAANCIICEMPWLQQFPCELANATMPCAYFLLVPCPYQTDWYASIWMCKYIVVKNRGAPK